MKYYIAACGFTNLAPIIAAIIVDAAAKPVSAEAAARRPVARINSRREVSSVWLAFMTPSSASCQIAVNHHPDLLSVPTQTAITPTIERGKSVIIAAHGNSLRALVKYLDGVSDQEIVGLNIPTGVPLVYELDERLKPLKHYYLGDPEEVARAAAAVAAQGKAK